MIEAFSPQNALDAKKFGLTQANQLQLAIQDKVIDMLNHKLGEKFTGNNSVKVTGEDLQKAAILGSDTFFEGLDPIRRNLVVDFLPGGEFEKFLKIYTPLAWAEVMRRFANAGWHIETELGEDIFPTSVTFSQINKNPS